MPATGGRVEALTVLDKERHDNYHSWPQLLPGGRLLLFVRTEDAKTTGLYAGSVTAPGLTAVLATPSRPVFAGGHLLWTMEDRLVAQPFDVVDAEAFGNAGHAGAGGVPGRRDARRHSGSRTAARSSMPPATADRAASSAG